MSSSTQDAESQPEPQIYDRVFWMTYLANGLVTVSNAMMVRYADFVNLIGGDERQLGLIVGCGMVGSIAMRLVQGEGIDRYGAGRVWRWSMLVFACAMLANLLLTSATGPAIFVVRIVMQMSVAGVFGASITFVSLRVAPQNMAEAIGSLGTSGFIGIMIGPLLGDLICGSSVSRRDIDRLFLLAGGMSAIGAATTWLATRHEVRPRVRRRPSVLRLLRRYTPWMIALMAAAMGAGFSIPMTFLRPFAKDRLIGGIGLFFVVYAGVAFLARVSTRRMFERYGNRPWIISGMALLAISFGLYLPVSAEWQLMFPGAIAGIAHALLFPSIISAGTSAFPRRYLGVSTSLMLAMFDMGTFIGAPIFGALLRMRKLSHEASPLFRDPYSELFAIVAVILAVVTIAFCLRRSSMDENG